jgi:thiamine biosynthesis lipoprotein
MDSLEESREVLGGEVSIKMAVFDRARAESALARAFAECERIEATYSRFISGNTLSDLNSRLGEWLEVDDELYALIAFGERLRVSTEGAFDLTVKSILDSWGYDAEYSMEERSGGALGEIELRDGQVRLGAEIDLGGIGKGYAIDRIDNVLREFANVCIDAGGDILARGVNSDGKPWRAVFEHPTDIKQGIGFVDVDGLALGCSSPSRRKWRDKHHLVEPKAGLPAKGMLAVYTQADAALIADAYSTALFALGFERAIELLPDLPVEAMLIGLDGKAWRSGGFKGELF